MSAIDDVLPDPGHFVPFIPYATIFKLAPPGEKKRTTVFCISCGAEYPLHDLLTDELNTDQCPTCKTWALAYWKDKPHRECSYE